MGEGNDEDDDDENGEDNKDNENDEDDKDNTEYEEEDFFFAKILMMIKYTSMPNLVRLAQWKQISDDILLLHNTSTTMQCL